MFFVYLSNTNLFKKKHLETRRVISCVQGGLWEKIKLPIYAGLWYFFNVSRLSLTVGTCRFGVHQKHGVSHRMSRTGFVRINGDRINGLYNTNFFPWDIQVNDLDVANDVVGHFATSPACWMMIPKPLTSKSNGEALDLSGKIDVN